MRYLILVLVIFASCSLEKRLSMKQRRANKLDFEISEIKKQLSLPIDSTILKTDTLIFVTEHIKLDTIKLKCDSNNKVVYVDNNEPLQGSEIIYETKYIETDKLINNDILKVKKEIIYKDRDYSKKEMILMAFGAVSIILLLMYSFGKFATILINIFKPKII